MQHALCNLNRYCHQPASQNALIKVLLGCSHCFSADHMIFNQSDSRKIFEQHYIASIPVALQSS